MPFEFSWRDCVTAARRRMPYFLIVTSVVLLGAGVLLYVLPTTYISTARILVESQQIPSDLAKSTITANALERVQVIQQRLMTRDNLLAIAERHDVYSQHPQMSPSDMVESMRKATTIEHVVVGTAGARRGPGPAIAFTISFQHENPAIASQVTNEFVTLMLQQNLEARTRRASETSRFFAQQVANLEKELVALEGRILEFKSANAFALQESVAQRQTQLSQMESEHIELTLKIRELEDKQRRAEREHVAAGAKLVSGSGEVELEQLNARLAHMRKTHHELHPEVRAVKARITALEALQTETGVLPALREQRDQLRRRIAAIQEAIPKMPQVEIALATLNRSHQDILQQLVQTRGKLADAEVGERLEADRQAERFEVIEQASQPTNPKGPRRELLYAGGASVSVAAGLAAMVAAELLDPRIRSERDMVKSLQLRPLVSVPYLRTRREKLRRRRNLTLAACSAFLIGILIAIHLLYLPLPLWFGEVAQNMANLL